MKCNCTKTVSPQLSARRVCNALAEHTERSFRSEPHPKETLKVEFERMALKNSPSINCVKRFLVAVVNTGVFLVSDFLCKIFARQTFLLLLSCIYGVWRWFQLHFLHTHFFLQRCVSVRSMGMKESWRKGTEKRGKWPRYKLCWDMKAFLVKHPLSKIESGMPRWRQGMNGQQLHPHNRL